MKSRGQFWAIRDENQLANFIEFIADVYRESGSVDVEWLSGESSRPDRTEMTLQAYCRMLAESLNEAGLFVGDVLKSGTKISWTAELVRFQLWNPEQQRLFSDSLSDLDAKQVRKVYAFIDGKWGIQIKWPGGKK